MLGVRASLSPQGITGALTLARNWLNWDLHLTKTFCCCKHSRKSLSHCQAFPSWGKSVPLENGLQQAARVGVMHCYCEAMGSSGDRAQDWVCPGAKFLQDIS